MIPDCDRRSDGRTQSIIAKTALCIASYADALSIKSGGYAWTWQYIRGMHTTFSHVRGRSIPTATAAQVQLPRLCNDDNDLNDD